MKALFIYLCLITGVAQSKEFSNQYLSFRLPNGWDCQLEGTEWVCQSFNKSRNKEAIIIMAAKSRGEKDDLAEYETFLRSPRNFSLPEGRTQISEPKFTKKIDLRGHLWIDSLHLASEVPGFYTRYLATVKGDLGIALTLSVNKENYLNYSYLFDMISSSLKVHEKTLDYRQKEIIARADNLFENGGGDEELFFNLGLGNQANKRSSSIAVGVKTNALLIIFIVISFILGLNRFLKRKE